MARQLETLTRQDELIARFRVTKQTLERYAALGLLSPMKLNDHTAYSARCVLHMEIIEVGKRLGFSLLDIKILIDDRESKSEDEPQKSG